MAGEKFFKGLFFSYEGFAFTTTSRNSSKSKNGVNFIAERVVQHVSCRYINIITKIGSGR